MSRFIKIFSLTLLLFFAEANLGFCAETGINISKSETVYAKIQQNHLIYSEAYNSETLSCFEEEDNSKKVSLSNNTLAQEMVSSFVNNLSISIVRISIYNTIIFVADSSPPQYCQS